MRLFRKPVFKSRKIKQPSVGEVKMKCAELRRKAENDYNIAILNMKESFYKEVGEYEQRKGELREMIQRLEESEKLARMWKPFKEERKLTTGQERSLQEMSETMKEAIRSIADELLRELSNKGMLSDGLDRDKPMWCGVGVNMLYDRIIISAKFIERHEERKKIKAKAEAEKEEKPDEKRTVDSLYKNPKV